MSGTDVPQSDRVTVDLDPARVLAAYVQHRRRFAASVADLDHAVLASPSRCSKWSVADVLRHGADVDDWMHALWVGESPFSAFDPNTTPHEFVIAGRAMSDIDARDRFVASSEGMAADIESSGRDRWSVPSVSPMGNVAWWMSALHVFFDSWLHERDVFIPMGIEPVVEPDEVVAVLTYSLALVGGLMREPIDVVVGGVRLVVGNGPVSASPVSPGDTIASAPIVDALSGRGAMEAALPDLPPETLGALGPLSRILTPATRKVM